MRPLHALAEDMRRIGIAALIAGLIGGFLQDKVPTGAAALTAILGALACVWGYTIHSLDGEA